MKILEIKKHVTVLNKKQLINLKGGSTNTADFIVIEDVDAL